jgi:alpha-1,2-mannosyltransferase
LVQQKLLGWSDLPPLKEWLLNPKWSADDSWMPMRAALDYVSKAGPNSLYQQIFFAQHLKFQYPPTSLLPMLALRSLGIDVTSVFLNNINRVLIAVNAIGVGFLFRLVLIRRYGAAAATSPAAKAGAILSGAATLLFYPVMMGFWLGQIQVWIDTGFTFACIALLANRKLSAGVLVGLICLLKPQFAVFAVWALLRREWRFILGAAIAILPLGLISVAVFGVMAHLQYLNELSFLSRHGEAMISNNSVNGILNALTGTANPLVWEVHAFPPYNPIVYSGSLAAAIILIVGALWPRPSQRGTLNGLLDFTFAALAFTMAAPIAWENHYGIMAPILATLFGLLAATPDSVRTRQQLIAFAAVFILSAVCVTSHTYKVATPLNLALGYLFFAGLGTLAMLWWVAQSRDMTRRP